MNNHEFQNALVGPVKRPFMDSVGEKASNFLRQAGEKIKPAGEYFKNLPSSLWGDAYRRGMRRGTNQLKEAARLKKDGLTDLRAINKKKRRGIASIREAQEAGNKTMRDRLIWGGALGGTGLVAGSIAANRNKNRELSARLDELSNLIEFSLVDQTYNNQANLDFDCDFAESYGHLSDVFEFHCLSGSVDDRLIKLNDLIDEAIAGNCLGE